MKIVYSQLSTKGQVVIPAEMREALELRPGTKISIQREGNMLILRPVTPEFIDSLIGCTQDAGRERERIHRDDEER